jgi:hypothetical protein
MFFYKKLSQISFLSSSYAFKFLFVAFIRIHIPLIGFFFCALWNFSISPNTIFLLLYDLVGFGYFAILKQLIKPIEFASMALRSYKEETSARPAISFS